MEVRIETGRENWERECENMHELNRDKASVSGASNRWIALHVAAENMHHPAQCLGPALETRSQSAGASALLEQTF